MFIMDFAQSIQNIAERQPALTENDRRLRGQFVDEYFVDLDPTKAVLRLGYNFQYARHMAEQFMLDSFVLKEISNRKNESPVQMGSRAWVENELLSRAIYSGPGQSETAKIAALKLYAEMKGYFNSPPVVSIANTYDIEGTCRHVTELTHEQLIAQCKERGLPTRIFENDVEL